MNIPKRKIGDIIHKTAVTCLIGFTAFTAFSFSYLTNMASYICRKFETLLGYIKLKALTQNFSSTTKVERTWNVIRANHVAIATSDIQQSVKLYEDVLGIKTSQSVPLPEHGVTTVFVELSNMKLELLHPLGDKSPIEKFLQKSPTGGMHHICLEVDNIENAVKDLKEKNIRLLSDEPKIGAHGKPVIFLHPKDCNGVLIELEEV
ncbi:methylmalonyl-CoA epimerase, mitochondrial [Caerostris darwini]|uniref:Methylmalonyl-CoA epimerase, mitochondrial n=1 Tax=Caerostris darwini TaxID=1538125 RepID=A0AAV4UU76_9ARAC|nr:methylmalonyl-CoA epimerase, mitochondrial [Caerostris darwini]